MAYYRKRLGQILIALAYVFLFIVGCIFSVGSWSSLSLFSLAFMLVLHFLLSLLLLTRTSLAFPKLALAGNILVFAGAVVILFSYAVKV